MYKGFKCLDVAAGRVYISRDVVFDESVYPFSTSNDEATLGVQRTQSYADQIVCADQIVGAGGPATQSYADQIVCADQIAATGGPAAQSCADQIVCADQITATGGPVTQSCANQIVVADQIAATGGPAAQSYANQIGCHVSVPDFSPSVSSVPLPTAPIRPSTRLQHGIRKPKVYTNGTIRYGLLTFSGEPNHLDEALDDSRWKSAMDQEYNALLKNNTCHLVRSK
jgi:hypothetical protein